MLYGAYYEWMIDLVRHGDKLWFSMLISRDKNSPVALHSGTMPIKLYFFINVYTYILSMQETPHTKQ